MENKLILQISQTSDNYKTLIGKSELFLSMGLTGTIRSNSKVENEQYYKIDYDLVLNKDNINILSEIKEMFDIDKENGINLILWYSVELNDTTLYTEHYYDTNQVNEGVLKDNFNGLLKLVKTLIKNKI